MNPCDEFDSYAFHDNLLHGISFLVEDFTAELFLEIDHILKWPTCADEKIVFEVSKARLRFCDISDLSINMEWPKKGSENAMSRIFIDKVTRHEVCVALNLPSYYEWRIWMSDGHSSISFGASTMVVELTKPPLSVDRQYLMSYERS